MANISNVISITQLPSIGNSFTPNTALPVVNTANAGNYVTDQASLGNMANYILTQAGNTLQPAFVANLAYAVTNAAQPNITSLGTLSVDTLQISGGLNGYFLQTDGNGNLAWVAGGGSGNGVVGGSNGQIQFNNSGSFGGSPNLIYNASNSTLSTANISALQVTVTGNVAAVDVTASGNITTGNLTTGNFTANGNLTANHFIGNGSLLTGITATANGAGPNTAVQYNANGVFAGNANFAYDYANHVLNVNTANINHLNANISQANHFTGEGGNLSNIQGANVVGAVGLATYAGTANAVAVANVIGIGNIATVALNGSSSQVLYGNGQWGAASSANVGNFAFDSTDIDGTTYDEIVLTGTNSGNIIVNADNLVMVSGAYQSDGLIAGGGNVYLFNGDPTYANGIPQPGVGHIWQFDDTGNTTLPTGAAIANISGFGPGLSTFFGDANGATFGTGPGNDITFTPADGAAIYSNGFMWTFSTDGNLTTPGNITGANVIEANTFLGTGNLHLQPSPDNGGAYLDVYLTGGPDIHIAGNGETVIVGSDAGANVSVQASGNVAIQANSVFGGTPHTWMFDYDSNLTLPQLTTINDVSGTGTTLTVGVPPTVIVISGADFVAVNTTYTRDFGQATPTWYPAGYTPGVNPYIMFTGGQYGIYNPGFVPPLYINTGTLNIPLIQWNLNPPLGSIAPTAVYTYGSTGPAWKFDPTGNLRLPGVLVAQASDNGSIIFSNNGTDTNGSFKVDGGLNMTVSANSNFYVKQAGQDRLAITNTNTDLMASSNVVIHANKAGSEQNWIFDTTGLLTIPGDINIRGVNINFPGQYGNINWGTSYMAFSQYGRINTNVDFFANANTIGADVLKTNSIIVSGNANVSGNLVLSSTTQIVSTPGSNGNITLDPDGTGIVKIIGNVSANYIISPAGSNSNITLDPDGTGVVNVIGNVVANNFSGNISITGNINGTSPNVTLVAGSYNYLFENTGNFTLPANGDIIMSGTGSSITGVQTVNVAGNITASGSAGVITPNRPAFRVYGSSSTIWSTTPNTNGILNANNWTVDYNQGSYLNSTTGTFTAPVAGLYQVNLVARVANNVAPQAQATVIKNYGSGNVNQVMWESANNPTINHFGVSTVSKLAAGDTLTLKITVGSLIFDGNDNWSVAFLG